MATQAPTFGLDGSELDVMDGLFFNELTDLPVEPAHNQTLFAQPKSEPPITDEELIASLPLPHEAPAPPPAPPPPPAKPAARGAAKDAADLSETRRARNREHARRSRCRKKLIIESVAAVVDRVSSGERAIEAICKGQIRRSRGRASARVVRGPKQRVKRRTRT